MFLLSSTFNLLHDKVRSTKHECGLTLFQSISFDLTTVITLPAETDHPERGKQKVRSQKDEGGSSLFRSIEPAVFYLSSIPALIASCSFGQNSTKRRFISPFTA
jgi:hypothetical protein